MDRTEDAVWASELEREELHELDPGVPTDLNLHPDVAVVGGGALGLATGAMCLRAGLRVVVLERARIGYGATGRSAGILAPEPHAWTDPLPLVELGRRSLRLTRQLDDEWHGGLGLIDLDCLIAGLREDEARIALAAPVEVLDAAAVREREPELVGVEDALVIHDQARVNPLRFALGLARHAGTVVTRIKVGELRIRHRRVVSVATSAGDLHPGTIVFATGIAPAPYVVIPHRLMKGHLLATSPVEFKLRTQISTPIGGAFQLEDGRLVAGGTLDEGDDPAVQSEVIDAVRRGMIKVLPRAAGAALSHVWCGFRPAAADRLPIVDRIPGLTNAWFTSGHYRTGILMAVGTAAALATWISSDSRPADMDSFAIDRLDATSWAS